MPMAHRIPAQMTPPTWRLCQSRRKARGTLTLRASTGLPRGPPIYLANLD